MTSLGKCLTAAAIIGLAAPAAAQYYPQPPQPYPEQYPQQYPQPYPGPYPQPGYGYQVQPGYGYGQNNGVLGSIIDGLIGNRYAVNDRQAIRQCTFAAVNQAEAQYRPFYNNNNNFRRPYQGYNGNMRVTAITDVQRRSQGRVRVRGLLDTGLYGNRGDLDFRCDVDYRGRVTNVRIDRNAYWGRRY